METLTATQKGVKVTVDREEFLKAWNNNVRVVDLVEVFGVTETTIKLWRRWNILPKRSPGAWRDGAVDDPTPAQIRERAAIERAKWTPEEEERRRCWGHQPVEMLTWRLREGRLVG